MDIIPNEMFEVIKSAIQTDPVREEKLPKKLADLRAKSEDLWLEYTTAYDLNAADTDDRFNAYEDAREAYIDAMDEYRCNPELFWDEEDSADAEVTTGSLRYG